MAFSLVESITVILVMWADGRKHKEGLYLQASPPWLAQPNQPHNFRGMNNWQCWEAPSLAKWMACSTPALFLSPLTSVHHSHIDESSDFLPNDGLWFYSAPRDTGETRPILLLTIFEGFLNQDSGWKIKVPAKQAEEKGSLHFSLTLGELHRWMHCF